AVEAPHQIGGAGGHVKQGGHRQPDPPAHRRDVLAAAGRPPENGDQPLRSALGGTPPGHHRPLHRGFLLTPGEPPQPPPRPTPATPAPPPTHPGRAPTPILRAAHAAPARPGSSPTPLPGGREEPPRAASTAVTSSFSAPPPAMKSAPGCLACAHASAALTMAS